MLILFARTVELRQCLVLHILQPCFHRVTEVSLKVSAFLRDSISTAADVNTTQCNGCLAEDNFDSCVSNTVVQNCTSPATDSCFSAIGRYKFTNGSTVVLVGASRGCIACPSKMMFV